MASSKACYIQPYNSRATTQGTNLASLNKVGLSILPKGTSTYGDAEWGPSLQSSNLRKTNLTLLHFCNPIISFRI